jgi:hypothetical protein
MGIFNYIQNVADALTEKRSKDELPAPMPRDPLTVQLLGEVDHPDFRDALALLRSTGRIVDSAAAQPELIVIAQSRPDVIDRRDVDRLRLSAPLAGIVGLMGTWCEGETRTGRPWPGVTRLYWYEFPAWWRRQMRLRAAGRCPDWARCGDVPLPDIKPPELKSSCPAPSPLRGGMGRGSSGVSSTESAFTSRGIVELCLPRRETADVIADVLHSAGYATVWHRTAEGAPVVRGIAAGIWDGGQLDDREFTDLILFCRRLARQRAPVIALLDFPRRDRVDYATEIGAAAVLGKPWMNWALIDAIESATQIHNRSHAA